MPTFKDKRETEWLIELDAPAIAKVRKECEIDLVDLNGNPFDRLSDDPVLLVDVLWVICRDQAKDKNVSDADFGRALVGDPIDYATAALLEAISDFFPQKKRSLLRSLAEKTRRIRETGTELAKAKVEDPEIEKALTEAMEARMTEEIKKALTRLRSPTSSPESSESIPEA